MICIQLLLITLLRSPIQKIGQVPFYIKPFGRYLGLGLLTFFLIIWGTPTPAQNLFISGIEQNPTQQTTDGLNREKDINLAQNTDQIANQLEQGKALYVAGRFWDAITVWQQAMEAYQAQGNRINHALSLSYLALAYQDY